MAARRHRRWLMLLGGLAALRCGGEPAPEGPSAPEAEPEPVAAAPTPAGDPLLTRAREGIRQGTLAAADEAALLASREPTHARARRILLAMAEPGEAERGEADVAPGDSPGAELRPPPILPDADASSRTPSAASSGSGSAGTRPSRASTPAPTSSARGGPARIGRLGLRPSKRGATLTIAGSSSMVVGVANQLSSGIVHLVIERARAAPSVLSSRPRLSGAEITGVRQGQGTVQITLRLRPGWTLGAVKSFSGGARVNLVGPR